MAPEDRRARSRDPSAGVRADQFGVRPKHRTNQHHARRSDPDGAPAQPQHAGGAPSKQNPNLYPGVSTNDYLKNNTEADIGLSYLIERGKKRQHRLQAARDITAQTRSLVADNERGLTFNTASLFVNAQLAESALELADKDLKS